MSIYSRIKRLRKKLKLSQSDFANKLGLSQNTIANYELGRRTPSEQVIRSICREFNVNRFWLTEGGNDDEMFLPEPNGVIDELKVQYNLNDIEIEILTNYLKLSVSQREEFMNFARTIFNFKNKTDNKNT